MKFYNKLVAGVVLTSFIGIQMPFIQSACAQEYKITPPPTIDQSSQVTLPDITNLPKIDVNPNYSFNSNPQSAVYVHAGTIMKIILNTSVSSANAHSGDIFTATLTDPVISSNKIVFPEGSEVIGQITYLEKAGRVGKNAVMSVKLIGIKPPRGQKVPMLAKIQTLDNSGTLKGNNFRKQIVKDAATVAVGSTGAGIAGLGLFSLIGEAGAGFVGCFATGGVLVVGYVLMRKGKNVELPGGSKLNVVLEQPLTVFK
ncbi:MAG: hypothetical protein PHC34_00500 [Candidatus Gastranaerophilales bacterium]|nr:hypothetical protein [Candidatus Gastranaerophilales bacterium]